ncbi:hypothetical protein N7541_006902 [Penicillium brevicompactum]|uniref:Uncharacterized protein n=1 Tax=Penicillium brevicompactum TaxID=5074 RepID=A0A9W9UR10_PENBR|nr:hypothetical protein N7541_006902 [Penicillium brevicompactum]
MPEQRHVATAHYKTLFVLLSFTAQLAVSAPTVDDDYTSLEKRADPQHRQPPAATATAGAATAAAAAGGDGSSSSSSAESGGGGGCTVKRTFWYYDYPCGSSDHPERARKGDRLGLADFDSDWYNTDNGWIRAQDKPKACRESVMSHTLIEKVKA